MGFNSAFKGLKGISVDLVLVSILPAFDQRFGDKDLSQPSTHTNINGSKSIRATNLEFPTSRK